MEPKNTRHIPWVEKNKKNFTMLWSKKIEVDRGIYKQIANKPTAIQIAKENCRVPWFHTKLCEN